MKRKKLTSGQLSMLCMELALMLDAGLGAGEGLRQMSAILKRICDGQGRAGDLEMLERLGDVMTDTALCALGQSAANPVLSSMRSFRDEWEEHVRDHHCRAGVCRCDALSEGGAA